MWGDPDEDPPRFEWYNCTVVKFRAGPRVKYRFVLHFDDGADDLVQLPDDTVVLLADTVDRCTCERCTCSDDAGRALPLP